MNELLHDYDFDLQVANAASTHSIQIQMIPEGSSVLDVGCHSGILGEYLRRKKQCSVVGIDTDEAALSDASTRLDKAFAANIETTGWSSIVREQAGKPFDIIVFGDVLEHTRDPQAILAEARTLLKPEGRVIVSIPNVAHWRIRLALLAGRFTYTESGILDRTHLRFFTETSLHELVRAAGYQVVDQDVAGYHLPHWLIRIFRNLLGVQFVLACKAT